MSARLDDDAAAARPLPRAMTLRDLPAVLALEVQAYSHPWTHGNFVDTLAAGHLAEVLVGVDGGVVGYHVAMPGAGELHLLNLTVAPERQRRGHGSALLERVHDHARRLGALSVWLEVRRSNTQARLLYRKRGYTEVGVRRGYYPATFGREDAVVMRRALGNGVD